MPKFTIGDKEYTFKRPVLGLTIEADELVRKSEVFDISKAEKVLSSRMTDPELFAKLNEDWLAFCRLVFVEEVGEDLRLENVVYPDDVVEAQYTFFSLPSERLIARLRGLNETLAASAASTKQ